MQKAARPRDQELANRGAPLSSRCHGALVVFLVSLTGSSAVVEGASGAGASWSRVGQGACEGRTAPAVQGLAGRGITGASRAGLTQLLASYGCEGGAAVAALGACQRLCARWSPDECGGVTFGESWCQLWVNTSARALAPAPAVGDCGDGYGGGWAYHPGDGGMVPIVASNASAGDPGDCYARLPSPVARTKAFTQYMLT